MSFDLLVISIGGTVAVVAMLQYFDKKRTRELAALAPTLGSEPLNTCSVPLAELSSINFFNIGRARSARNVFCFKKLDRREFFFEYQYTTGSGKHRHTHTHAVLLIEKVSLPSFSLGPEGFFNKIGDLLGFKDIDFQDSEEFSKKYLLKGPDEQAIRNLFSPTLRKNLLALGKFHVDSNGSHLVVHVPGKALRAKKAAELLQELRKIAQAFPYR